MSCRCCLHRACCLCASQTWRFDSRAVPYWFLALPHPFPIPPLNPATCCLAARGASRGRSKSKERGALTAAPAAAVKGGGDGTGDGGGEGLFGSMGMSMGLPAVALPFSGADGAAADAAAGGKAVQGPAGDAAGEVAQRRRPTMEERRMEAEAKHGAAQTCDKVANKLDFSPAFNHSLTHCLSLSLALSLSRFFKFRVSATMGMHLLSARFCPLASRTRVNSFSRLSIDLDDDEVRASAGPASPTGARRPEGRLQKKR